MTLKQNARVMAAAERELAVRPVRAAVDFGAVNRLADYAAMRRAEMGPEKWAEIEREWESRDV